jgi:hypothetical protein
MIEGEQAAAPAAAETEIVTAAGNKRRWRRNAGQAVSADFDTGEAGEMAPVAAADWRAPAA